MNITKRVLQGRISPLLFSVFLNDNDNEFRKNNLTGLNINGHQDIIYCNPQTT